MEALFLFNRILQDAFGNDDDTDDDIDADDLPPLIPKQSLSQDMQENSNQVQAGIEKFDTAPLYPTARLNFETQHGFKDMPSLINVTTGEILQDTTEKEKEEEKPVVYKKMIVQGETLDIAEHIIKDIPYIETLLSGRFNVTEEEGIVKTDEINPHLFKLILKYLESGKLYKLLACLPKNYDVYQLFELLHFLAIKPPIKTTLEDIKKRLGKKPACEAVSSQKELVEFAFAIFHGYHLLDYRKVHRKTRDNIYNVIMTIFKNESQSFKPRAKFHLLKIAKKCVLFSFNQFQKIKLLKVSDNLDNSDTESIGPIPYDIDWYDDCWEHGYYDSDEPWEHPYHYHDFLDEFDWYDHHYYDSDSDFSDFM